MECPQNVLKMRMKSEMTW